MSESGTEEHLISPEVLHSAAEILKALGHPVRLQIVELLGVHGEMPVFQIQNELHLPQSITSQHLSKMRALGLVKGRRGGGVVMYRLGKAQMVRALLDCLRLHLKPEPRYQIL